jgi:hypothetical protein
MRPLRGDGGMPPVAGGGEDVRLMAHGDVENPRSLLPCQERTRLFIGVREKALHGARLAEVGNPCRANCGGADGEIRHRLCLRSFCCRNQEDEGAST